MVEFHYYRGAVYILENSKAQRIKVGMTTNDVADRLRSVNDMWLERKATCQICGGRRLVNKRGLIPRHVISGRACPGGEALPLEKDVILAESYLKNMKVRSSDLSGNEKASSTRIINNLEKRIELYRHHNWPVGVWQLSTFYYTVLADQVESLSHKILAEHLDKKALFGEVFCCSVAEASAAIEAALCKLGLLHSARKEIKNYDTSEKHGTCIICGNNLTETGACPDCMRRF